MAKFLVFKNLVEAGHTAYAVLGLLGSYLGIYFYLRVIQFMFMNEAGPAVAEAVGHPARRLSAVASVACLVATLVVSVFPGWVLTRL